MTEHPIPFTSPMVRAILAGTKTVTRRPVRSAHSQDADAWCWVPGRGMWESGIAADYGRYGHGEWVKCPYGAPGDTLWVRENWTSAYARGCWGTLFQADGAFVQGARQHAKGTHYNAENLPPRVKWRPSIHMPRWAARILLEVTAVRVERVQSITEEQAMAEGVAPVPFCRAGVPAGNEHVEGFSEAWGAMYGERPYAWERNPWVWVVSFRRIAR